MRWYGKIGYDVTEETRPGIWETRPVERYYYGDVIRNTGRWSMTSESTNGSMSVNNQISVVADPYAYEHFHHIRYVEFMGDICDVTSIEVQRPRLILTIGGVYNGEQA